jgi:multiple sugar transport system ATP-binding protein
MTVADNMGFALKLAKINRKEIDQSVSKVAEILRIEHLLKRKPKELSGGERQRVAIGRAIVRKPKVFLFDEPLSNLDAALRVQMRLELTRLHRELGSTMIYVTHDQVEAMTMGDRIAVFNKGRIEQIGKPSELYSRPTNQFVASFLGSPKINFIKGCLKSEKDNRIQVTTIGGVELEFISQMSIANTGNEITVGVRPEHFALVEPGKGIAASISLIENLGDSAILHVSSIEVDSLISVKISAEECIDLAVGNRIDIMPRTGYCILFDIEGKALDCSEQKVKH